jgi:hypothetical protein
MAFLGYRLCSCRKWRSITFAEESIRRLEPRRHAAGTTNFVCPLSRQPTRGGCGPLPVSTREALSDLSATCLNKLMI